ncbi:glucuronate isomerase [Microbacterium resistens]|uniref:Uronate isomerase n=1 Tax=Microbacterium resistens TaxID=156977 RepID=A0ABU1SDY7_9MICO|nr:glucuronate isomerase [Microbacterium resistens]MDR6867113.1 glucuronate isomerase [Microbacterium resistens]
MTSAPLTPHPDRLLPADPGVRRIARALYAEVADAPILSPHGHVDAALLADDLPFPDPATLLITPDHYVLRLLHATGTSLDALGRGPAPADPRDVWRAFCTNWDVFLGTPVRYWFETSLSEVFGVTEQPSAGNADELYDHIDGQLRTDAFRPRALFERFRIEVLATTDDPAADLGAHARLREDPSFRGRVLPTFRADRYMDPGAPGWASALDELSASAGVDAGSRAGLLAALRARREAFLAAGATATDTGVLDAGSDPLAPAEAERIHAAALRGEATPAEAVAYRRDMLYRLAEMAAEDGLVMQLHSGVIRNHHRATLERFGPDSGHDLPDVAAFTRPLTPILEAFGTSETFRMVLFTVDETAFSREIAPLAGFYPSVYAGAPWWFIDTPDAIGRFRRAVTDSAGFVKTSGFIDDTRAFCSIPARHDMSRRVDAGYLAGLVAEHRLDEGQALVLAHRLVDDIPRATFRL